MGYFIPKTRFVHRHHQLIDFKELEQVFLSLPSTIYANSCMLTENRCSKMSISASYEMLRFLVFCESDFFKTKVFPKVFCKANRNILQKFQFKIKPIFRCMLFLLYLLLFHNTQREMHDIMLYYTRWNLGEVNFSYL